MQDIPEIESNSEKEVYAFFGLAVYMAQVLEYGAVNFAFALSLPEVNLATRDLAEEINRNLERKTFGQLLKICRREFSIEEGHSDYLSDALETRNMLIHRFFRDRIESLMSESGRIELMKELQDIISKLNQADEILESMYLPILGKYGITQEYITRQLEIMQQEAQKRDADA